jgi:ATP-dependent helicase/nuclease subunit A
MSARPLSPEADRNQSRASDPSASAWVSANAGTGKTAVLVRRSLRLLLAGSTPESILCLTYTKTAAAEMQNRLLERLAVWATIGPGELTEDLMALLGRAPDEKELRDARRLFARALEAKGGLKIHTIHGFCERLLQRFPLESQVTPHFSVLDEREQALMRRAAFDTAVSLAAADNDSVIGRALGVVIALTSEGRVREVIDVVCGKRSEFARMMAYHKGRGDWPVAEALALKRLFNVAEHDEEVLSERLASVLTDDEIDAALAAFAAFGSDKKVDNDADANLRTARASQGGTRTAALEPVFLTQDGKVRAQVCSKGFADEAPKTAARLIEAQAAFTELTDQLAHVRLAEASAAVLALADAVQADYERRKQAEAALDYDDLIVKTQNLLSRADAAAWVLYKIDGGIDHILVDEAQDTNPAQWAIIEALAIEFFSGRGATDKLRTLFAVGDEKQSIYSFQGADPTRFGEVGRAFRQRAAALGLAWHEVPLNLSFRSTEPILQAVDRVFGRLPAADGLVWQEGASVQHHAFRTGQAGLVELWEIEKQEKPEASEAFEPWNEESAGARSVDALCKRIAATIEGWIDNEPLPAKGRKVRAGDILILVRRRDPFTTPMIRELKRLRVKVAGADRMKLMDQLAVQDLVALADVLLMPEDNLALAVVLKSPLFGFNDDDLFKLAHDRKGSLWTALKAKMNDDPRFAAAAEKLSQWLGRADLLPPYEFFSELLGADDQRLRKAMLTRLGPEAAEAIDEFLDLALNYDREAAPSLQGFVNQLRAGDVEIKRDMEQQRDEVRIMTVHGAKGLQAPIVILPDTCMRPRLQGVRLYPVPRAGEPADEVEHLVWPPAGHSNLAGIEDSKILVEQAERQEYHRLLYVAMTRAEDRLYICGWEGLQQRETGKVWYDLVKDGLDGLLTSHVGADGKAVRRMKSAQAEPAKDSSIAMEEAVAAPLPKWAGTVAPRERARPKLAPSRLAFGLEGGAEGLAPEQPPLGPLALSKEGRYARGRLVHALLQHLPEVEPEGQERAARAFVAARGTELAQQLKDEIVAESLAIVRDPTFAPLFQPGSLAEVPVVARIGAYDLEGQIDRLVVVGDSLLILDYKTNRPPPKTIDEVARAYIAQLAGYRTALKGLFPGRPLRAALLWTDGPRLMEIPSPLLDEAEQRLLAGTASLDGMGTHT